MQELIAAVQQTNLLLSSILSQIQDSRIVLGFQDTTVEVVYLNAVKCQGYLWYKVHDGVQEPIAAKAFTGYLQKLTITDTVRRDKETKKLNLWMVGEDAKTYRFECGLDSQTAKNILSSIAAMAPDQIQSAMTIRPKTGNDASVLFLRFQIRGNPIFAPYNNQTNWETMFQIASDKLAANAKPEESEAEEIDGEPVSTPRSVPAATAAPTAPVPVVTPKPITTTSNPSQAATLPLATLPPGVIDQFKIFVGSVRSLEDVQKLASWAGRSPQVEAFAEVPQIKQWVEQQIASLYSQYEQGGQEDLSDLLANISSEMSRAGWDMNQGRAHIQNKYGKRSRQELAPYQLREFLEYLQEQPTPLFT
jgi:hypothetical protein